MNNKKTYFIGIAGGSGSGKSTFAKKLKDHFPNDIALISCDNYYLSHADLPLEERKKLNYDSPEAFEYDLMVEQMRDLKEGKAIISPVYDYTLQTRSKKTETIESKPIIIMDGILILSEPELRDVFDLKIYVETDADERILRRLKRDVVDRGRDIDGVITQYLTTVKPMHNMYVEPTKMYADIIINGGLNDVAFDVVKTKILNILKNI